MCIGERGGNGLVSDRFADFQRFARSAGSLPAEAVDHNHSDGSGAAEKLGKARFLHKEAGPQQPSRGDGKAKPTFMRAFFEAVGPIQATIEQGRASVLRSDMMLDEMLRATTQDAQQAASDGLNQQVETTMSHISMAKQGLESLRAQADRDDKANPSPAQRSIRGNMQQALAKKHQQLLLDFQRSQQNFKRALEQRQVRELQLLCPEASGEQLQQMVEAGETSSQMMVRRMAGAHAGILEEVERIRDKHQDILKLEKSISDLAQMFQEMAILVDAQGELLDSIENCVHSTNEYTGKGVKELVQTRKIQSNTRKWQCCLAVFCFVVLAVALGPILFR